MNLTLIIPVRHRQQYIPRVTDFFKNLNCRKIIADSSNKKYNGKIIKEFEYQYFGPILYYEKMYKLLNSIDTKYYLECPDDDFIINESIIECLDFLEKTDKNYIWCDGLVSGVVNGKFRINIRPEMIINKVFSNRVNKNYYSDDVLTRISYELNCDFQEPNHAILKVSTAKKFWKLLVDNTEIQPMRWFAKIFAIVMACEGNHKTLPVLFHVKNEGTRLINYPHMLEKSLKCHLSVHDLSNYEKCSILSEYISSYTNRNKEEITHYLVDLFKGGPNNFGYTEVYTTNKPAQEMPLHHPKYDHEKKKISSYY